MKAEIGINLSMLLVWALIGSTQAALIDNGVSTLDTDTGFEWLDLSSTRSMTVTNALSIFGPEGYRYANDTEVEGLLAAFNITYLLSAGTTIALTTAPSDVALFTSLFGPTIASGGSLGGFELEGGGRSAYLCISSKSCAFGGSFVSDSNYPLGNSIVGQFLVRGGATVPEPGSLALLLLGFLALGFKEKYRVIFNGINFAKASEYTKFRCA